MTYFEKVSHFNTQFGVKLHTTPQSDIFDSDPKTVNFCMKLINEEYGELQKAVEEKNFVEVADAIADSVYVLLGMAARLGINMDKVFDTVHENNMEKFCPTESDAQKSVEHYLCHPELGFDTPAYRKTSDDKYWVVYNESTHKILKSISWKPVDLNFLLDK